MIKYILFFIFLKISLFSFFKEKKILNFNKNYNLKKFEYIENNFDQNFKIEIIFLGNQFLSYIKLLSNKLDKNLDNIKVSIDNEDEKISSICKVFKGNQVIKLDNLLNDFLKKSLLNNKNIKIFFLDYDITLENQKIKDLKNNYFDKIISLVEIK
jgi:hypothetical protein